MLIRRDGANNWPSQKLHRELQALEKLRSSFSRANVSVDDQQEALKEAGFVQESEGWSRGKSRTVAVLVFKYILTGRGDRNLRTRISKLGFYERKKQ